MSKEYDLVYCFWPHFQQCPEIITPLVCTFQDTIILDFPEILEYTNTKEEWRRSKKWVENSWIVVSSENTKNRLIHHFNNSIQYISKVPHVALPWTCDRDKKLNSEILKTIPSNYILYPANISIHKNHYNLLVALSFFTHRYDIPIVFTGLGSDFLKQTELDWNEEYDSQSTRLIGLIDRMNLKHGKDFFALGYVGDLDALALLQNAKAIVMPSLAEGGGSYPVEEALTFGVPVLCSDIPVMREHLSTWNAKIIWFNPYSPDSIGAALNEMVENYDIYKKSAIENMNNPRQSWDEIASNYIEVFKKAIEFNT